MKPLIQSLDFHISTPLGYQVAGRYLSPPYPTHRTIILCPPPKHGMDFFRKDSPLNWKKWFALGCNILLFDPLGYGDSWGVPDWGGIEDQESLKGLLKWLEARGEDSILFVSFGASILSVIKAHPTHPIICFDPVYSPKKLIGNYPELANKTKYFWRDRKISGEQFQKITVLSLKPNSWRKKLHRRKILLWNTLGLS